MYLIKHLLLSGMNWTLAGLWATRQVGLLYCEFVPVCDDAHQESCSKLVYTLFAEIHVARGVACDLTRHPPLPQVTPITVLKSDVTLQHVRNIAVSPTYICYSLKLGQVSKTYNQTWDVSCRSCVIFDANRSLASQILLLELSGRWLGRIHAQFMAVC